MTLAQLLGWIFLALVIPPLVVSFVREMGLLSFLAVAVATVAVLAGLTALLVLADSVRLG